MQAYNMMHLSADLQQWMNARFLNPILNIEGGWEYWIQIDFPAWLDVRDAPVQYDFRREIAIPNYGRLDWLINSQVMGQTPVAVEIKAQTHKYTNARFLADVDTDLTALRSLPATYQKLMLAAVVDQTVYDELIGKGFGLYFQYANTVAFLALYV